nr:putative ribonuclease H-like domain-containing protein [Tanacetum cinerariifolium]
MNKLVKGNLVQGLPSKTFENDHTCVACQKGKQHKVSCKDKLVSSISQPLQMLHMHLIGPTSIKSINHKILCLVVTDDFSRLSWVFFLATKSETSGILKKFITEIENQLNKKVKVIRFKENVDVGHTEQEKVSTRKYIVFPLWSSISSSYMSSDDKAGDNTTDDAAGKEKVQEPISEYDQALKNVLERMMNQEKKATEQSDDDTFEIQTTGIFGSAYDEDDLETNNHSYANESVGAEADFNNMEPSTIVRLILTTRVHSNHLKAQIIGDLMNKAKLVAQGHTQEESIDYDEVFSPVARVKAIRLFLAFASYMNFSVYQLDVKSAFLYETIKEEVYVDDIIFGSTKKYLCDEFDQIMHNKFQMSSIGELTFFLGLQVQQKRDGIFINQDKYVGEILKKFGFFSIRLASTPVEAHNPLTKDENGEDVDVRLCRSMIGSLMYLISSRPDIMFSVFACSRFQVQTKVSHLPIVKRIFRYLKGQYKLGLWYPKDSPLTLEDFSDSDYTLVANLTTEVEYIAASHCCGQVLWIQNQMMDYGYNFMQKNIHVYVDDIIFGSTKKYLCDEFDQIMHNKFQMSSIGELTFFLGLQVQQKRDGIFINQDKYVGEILKKFGFFSIRLASTPVEAHNPLTKDENGEDVDVRLCRSMIGSLMYLISSRPDIMFSVCACSRFQVQTKVSHLPIVKR